MTAAIRTHDVDGLARYLSVQQVFRSAKGEVGHPAACLAVRVASMLASVKERGYHKCVGVTMIMEPMLRSIILMVHSSVGAMVWWFSRGMLDNTFSVTCGYVRCE